MEEKYLDLGVEFDKMGSYEDYAALWKKMAGVQALMIEKNKQCKHNIGDRLVYKNHYDKPAGICPALHHVLQLYVLRASIGFPSWEDDPSVYRRHCPDKKGTVWELERTVTSAE